MHAVFAFVMFSLFGQLIITFFLLALLGGLALLADDFIGTSGFIPATLAIALPLVSFGILAARVRHMLKFPKIYLLRAWVWCAFWGLFVIVACIAPFDPNQAGFSPGSGIAITIFSFYAYGLTNRLLNPTAGL